MKHITTYHYRKHTYEIVHTQGFYCAISESDIGKDGKLKRKLNGLTTFADKELEGCIKKVNFFVDVTEDYGSVENYIASNL